MTESKRYYIGNGKNCTICDSNQGGSDFYNMLTQFEAVDRLNEQDAEIKQLKRHIERNTISRITVEDVLGCAKDHRFYDNEEIGKAIDCIAKDLGVNLY